MSAPSPLVEKPISPRKRRPVLVTLGLLVLLLAGVIGGACWYATTPRFENLVRQRVVFTLEAATGGRVELGSFHWRLRYLEFEASNLTIHGLEGPGEVPYAHLDRLMVRAKIISLFRARIGLNLLQGEHPVFHLIVYPDGSTNQPHPKVARTGGSTVDTLFDLAVDHAELSRGLLLFNQRQIPFDLSANDLAVAINYDGARGHYLAAVGADDIDARREKLPAVHSRISLHVDLSRTGADVSELELATGPKNKLDSVLEASGSFSDYADPHFALKAQGKVDLRELDDLTGIDGLDGGMAELQLNGKGSLDRYAIDGQAKLTGVAYVTSDVRAAGVNASTQVHLDQDDLALTKLNIKLREGGRIDGDFKLLHWAAPDLPEGPGKKAKTINGPAPVTSQGMLRVHVRDVSLRTVLRMTAPKDLGDLGFDTAATGEARADWTGAARDIVVSANVAMTGGGEHDGVPLSGTADATYYNGPGNVEVRKVVAQTPASHIELEGSIGVHPLHVAQSLATIDVVTTDLAEFDKTLIAGDLSTTGPNGPLVGVKAIPVHLHGQAEIHATISGSILNPDVKGQVTATNFDTVFEQKAGEQRPGEGKAGFTPAPATGTATTAVASAVSTGVPDKPPGSLTNIHWDSLNATVEYSPDGVTVQQGTLLSGKTAIHVKGQLHRHRISAKHAPIDDESAIAATVSVQEAPVPELLAIAGENAGVNGSLSLEARVGGTLGNLSGGGHVAVKGGEIYGQPYHSLNSDLRFAGQELDATNLKFLQNGGQISGDGGYDLRAKTMHFQAKGSGFDLAHIPGLQSEKLPVSGALSFDASGSGAIDHPTIQANAHLGGLTIDNRIRGNLDAKATLIANLANYDITAVLDGAPIHLSGHTQLVGDYPTQAQLLVTQVNVQPYLDALDAKRVTSSSVLTLKATVSGPARKPRTMEGTLDVDKFTASVGGIALRSENDLHAQLRSGVVHLDPLKITGDDTNLQAQGSVAIFDGSPTLDLHANGSINVKLAQTFDPDITSSGHVDFFVDAGGTMQNPNLVGQVKFANAAISLGDLPNGLSQINGILVFDQNRLTVQSLTAVTGGGRLSIGGFITYQQGIYIDMSATGKDVRIRYPQGVSSMADANFRLQGTTTNLQLSGNVMVTRFSISPNLDLAALKSSSIASATLPDPNAPSNHVRLDVHITSAPELNFQNSFAKLAGDVDLRIRGTIASPAVLGHISITDGSATFSGTTYQLQRGEIYFSNPIHIDPVIDLDATARVEDYDIDVGLHGTISKLNLSYRSEPPLPEADIFALLALGRTQEEQRIYSQEQQAAGVNSTADALLGGALNATVSNRVQKLFGVGSVKIDPTFVGSLGNSTARITVEQKITNQFVVTYATNVNETSQQLIQGQLFLSPTVSLVAQRDESGVFSLILKIHQRRR
jgi:translocation and assembly module TamB